MRRSVWNCAATAACSLKVKNDRTGLTDNNVVDGVDGAIVGVDFSVLMNVAGCLHESFKSD